MSYLGRVGKVGGVVALQGCFYSPMGSVQGGSTGSEGAETGPLEPTSSVGTSSEASTDSIPAPLIRCTDESASIADGFIDVAYPSFEVAVSGGVGPYVWSATGLPPGLTLEPGPDGATTATIVGTPALKGSFKVDLKVTDAEGVETTASCGELVIRDPIALDTDDLLGAFPDGCVPLGVGLDELLAEDILADGDGTPITCEFVPGPGSGSKKWDGVNDTHPSGLALDSETCAWTGKVSQNLPFGTYTFITTFTQSGQETYVPYCAPQQMQAPTAYNVIREDTGSEATFKPGLVVLDADGTLSYGTDVPDPKVTVTDVVNACAGTTCFYSFVFAFDTLSSAATVSANPNSKFPAQGFAGFTHAVRVASEALEIFSGRAYVVSIDFDYCITSNSDDCGNGDGDTKYTATERAALIKMNGGGSNYHFSLIALPKP